MSANQANPRGCPSGAYPPGCPSGAYPPGCPSGAYPPGCPSGAYDFGQGKEAKHVMTMVRVWTRESIDRWKIYRASNQKVLLFPRILPGRKTTIPFLERLKALEWQDPSAAIEDSEWASIISYYGHLKDEQYLSEIWAIWKVNRDALSQRAMILEICRSFQKVMDLFHPLLVLQTVLWTSKIDWSSDLKLKDQIRELVAIPGYQTLDCHQGDREERHQEDQELASWILEAHPIRDDASSWNLLSKICFPDRVLDALIKHTQTSRSAIQLWAEHTKVDGYHTSYTVLTSNAPLKCATGPRVRIQKVYFYFPNRLIEFRNTEPFPSFWLRNFLRPSMQPRCLTSGVTQNHLRHIALADDDIPERESGVDLRIASYGPGFRTNTLVLVPDLFDQIASKMKQARKQARLATQAMIGQPLVTSPFHRTIGGGPH